MPEYSVYASSQHMDIAPNPRSANGAFDAVVKTGIVYSHQPTLDRLLRQEIRQQYQTISAHKTWAARQLKDYPDDKEAIAEELKASYGDLLETHSAEYGFREGRAGHDGWRDAESARELRKTARVNTPHLASFATKHFMGVAATVYAEVPSGAPDKPATPLPHTSYYYLQRAPDIDDNTALDIADRLREHLIDEDGHWKTGMAILPQNPRLPTMQPLADIPGTHEENSLSPPHVRSSTIPALNIPTTALSARKTLEHPFWQNSDYRNPAHYAVNALRHSEQETLIKHLSESLAKAIPTRNSPLPEIRKRFLEIVEKDYEG
jgi:hypothetical protein